jgi:hypothetical protein
MVASIIHLDDGSLAASQFAGDLEFTHVACIPRDNAHKLFVVHGHRQIQSQRLAAVTATTHQLATSSLQSCVLV